MNRRMIKKKNNKILVYIRYSSHNQDNGNSVASQLATIQAYVDANGLEIEKIYIDTARTGRNTNRPQYQQMIDDIEQGRVEAGTIVVRGLDRLHRNAGNYSADREFFEKHKIRFVSILDGIDTDNEPNKLLETVRAAIAEDFSDTLSKNTRACMLECAKQCRHLGGTPPIGYKVNAEGFYEIDETRANIVRDIYKLYLQNMGYDYIIKYLKQKGYKTSTGKDFSKSSLNTILKNPKYTGTYVYDRSAPKDSKGKRNSHSFKSKYVEVENGMPAIISAEDFRKVQEKMAENSKCQSTRTGKNFYALNGFVKCGKCGKAMSGNVSNSKGNKYYYYKNSCSCGVKGIKTQQLNNFVFNALKQCIYSPENKKEIIDKLNQKLSVMNHMQSAEINELKNKINGLELAQNNLTEYLEAGKATHTILNKLQKNETELMILNTQLKAKSGQPLSVDEETYNKLIKQFTAYMGNNKTSESIALRDASIDYIEVEDDDINIYFKPGILADDNTVKYFNRYKENDA